MSSEPFETLPAEPLLDARQYAVSLSRAMAQAGSIPAARLGSGRAFNLPPTESDR